jgi:peptide/nickel transport system permease protein
MILAVGLAIVFFAHLGIGMVDNSTSSRPNYDLTRRVPLAWRQSLAYLAGALHGDFGTVMLKRGPVPVRSILADTYGKSMGLLGASLAAAASMGVLSGMLAGVSRRSRLVLPLLTLTVLGISTPTFFAALLLQLADIKILQALHVKIAAVGGFGWDNHMILPALVLAARPLAYVTRATYMALAGAMQEDYVRTARAKGLGEPHVVNVHALRNIAVPVLTSIGVSLRFALGSLPVVEFFFAWPGLGDRLLEAVRAGETPVVATLALALGLTFLGVNLLLDIVFRYVDPRLKEVAL